MTALAATPLSDLSPSAGAGEAPLLDRAVWQRVLTHVRLTNPTLNRTWFTDLVPRQLPNGVIHVTCTSVPQLNFLTGPCQQAFIAAAQAVTNRLSVVLFHCQSVSAAGVVGTVDGYVDRPAKVDPTAAGIGGMPLSPDNAFENFVIGPDNRLAQAVSVAVASKPGGAYNPLFLHGGCGLGKTHLLQAICQRILEKHPSLRILYLSCDAFINQFMNAVENGDMNNFRFRYRSADVLVIDDIQFLKGRQRTQEEFFHTFNTLHGQGKQIVLSADCPPNEVPELEERLVSRFNSGLVTGIEKPCFETRVAILQRKSRLRGVELGDDVLNYIAGRIDSNTRELEGAISKLQGMSLLNATPDGEPGPIDLEVARKALGETVVDEPRRTTIESIIEAACTFYGVKQAELQGKRRNRSIAFPRQVCMFLARKHTRYSLHEVGGYFGGRDHTTVLHGVRQVKNFIETNADIAQQVARIEQQLKA